MYEHRLVLVSTCKTEKGHGWRLDRAYAERNALEEYVSEEEEPVRTRPKRSPRGYTKPAPTRDHEYEERMVASAEARQMLLGEQVALMREHLEDQRVHNIDSGNMLCTVLNARGDGHSCEIVPNSPGH